MSDWPPPEKGRIEFATHDRLMPMAMAGLIWVCLLVVIVLIVAPLFGTWVAAVAALVSLAAITLICFAVCAANGYRSGIGRRR